VTYPKVSIIVPIYKVEEFLEQCFAALDSQTYPDLEIILVDDGSPDNYGARCDEYAKGKENVRVIHQENQGPAAARNDAVKIAEGEYIIFVDSDDFFTSDYVQYLVELLLQNNADMAIAAYKICAANEKFCDTNMEKSVEVLNTEEALTALCYGRKFSAQPWGKIYKKELLIDYPYPKGKYYEDVDTTYKLIGDCTRIVFGDKLVYYWIQHKGSITHMSVNEKQLYGVQATKNQLEYVKNRFPSAIPAAEFKCAAKLVDFSTKYVLNPSDKEIFKFLKSEMKQYIKSVCKNPKNTILFKIRCISLYLGYIPNYLVSHAYALLKKI
jgi:glycosyltransferase involved in cell wall biosynthesis